MAGLQTLPAKGVLRDSSGLLTTVLHFMITAEILEHSLANNYFIFIVNK